MNYKHECLVEDAPTFATWIKDRGGVAVWRSINLSNPGASWSTPAMTDGKPTPKPTWQAEDKPHMIVTAPEEIGVFTVKEVNRFHVAVRSGSSNPLLIKCTDASSRKVMNEVEKAGEGAFYRFDYDTQEAVIFKPDESMSLKEWMEKQ